MLLTSSWLLDMIIILSSILILAYKFLTRHHDYWKKKGINFKKPTLLAGNLLDVLLLRKTFHEWIIEMYSSTTDPLFGIFLFDQPGLLVRCPEIIKDILIKDFDHFVDRTVACPPHNEIVRNMLFFQRGEPWRVQRRKLTPVFTSGKLKGMLPILDGCAKKLVHRLQNHPDHVDVRPVTLDYVTDGISKAFFGIESYSQEETESEFKMNIRKINSISLKVVWSRICYFFYPQLVNPLKLNFGNNTEAFYFCDAFHEALKARKNSNVRLNDFVDIVNDMTSNEEFIKEFNVSGRGALAQPFMFFVAAQGTTSSVLSFIIYELAVHPEIQEKLRQEILNAIKDHDGLSYEALVSMKYMDMCIKEALRKYPSISFLDRRCTKPYTIEKVNIVIPEGSHIYIPTSGLHYDEQYFPDPDKFIPERFAENHTINSQGLYYIPFGEGPRGCIGERMGMMNVKLALSRILTNFRMEYPPDRPKEMVYDRKAFTVDAAPGHIKINFRPLE